jgi:LPXTG-motif cell wall-anchored protein
MTLINGAQACNIYWQVGSSATLGTNSRFIGHIYALTSITATTGATISGQLLARNGAVTLDNNTIVNDACTTPAASTTTTVVASATTAPRTTPTSPVAVDELPSTGSNTQALVLVSGVLALLGTAVLLGSKRKSSRN